MKDAAPTGEIRDTPLAEALGERYLSYALSTIMSRSLPDVRDGLKPVHRRLLYAMRQLKLDPTSGYKKCARVVGDVIGKYHPHGDVAVYETLVRLAQEFAVRYPLVDGQGNFGNIDGDNAAAMRYTEARMTAVAQALLEGIDENAVDFRDTYDGEDEEPVVLPARFPNLLANGAAGIAVGMATNIPPHNVGELCDALILLNKTPSATVEELVGVVRGPDFPTGGILAEAPGAILEAYRTGRGSFRLRARWESESLGHGQYQIVITEIPYQVPKARIIERVAELLAARKLPMLADIRDESTDDVRIVLEPKSRTVEAEHLMEHLFRLTDLEVRFGLNMNVLGADNTPRVMNLKEVLAAFLEHRQQVLVRRTEFRLDKIERRLEILGGLLIAYLNLDEVIRIIREEDEPKAELIRAFKLTDTQAEAILNMRLRHLRRLEEQAIRTENAELTAEKADLQDLLAKPQRMRKVIGAEMLDIRKQFGPDTALGKRRTDIGDAPSAIVVPLEAMIEREPITVICSEKGWIRAIKGHMEDLSEVRYKEGDRGKFILRAQTTDKLLVFATNGRFYTVGCDKLPGGRGNGEPLRLMIDLDAGHDVVGLMVHRPGGRLLVAGESGRGFVVEEDAVIAQTRAGKQILNLADGEEAALCAPIGEGADSIAVVGNNRKLLIFGLDEVPVMTRGRGVILQRYGKGGLIADAIAFKFADGLTWPAGTRTRTETNLAPWHGKRAQAGRLPPGGFPRSNRFTGGPVA
ncbi:DNA topoisomerase IV subunit A [Shumkonia mesophila]|uniref:DNA topoisomerase IV subunit A n=1 Tax=Shumkonia mesophila TaxID=2838854 RepID=UPI002934A395|nr:DNA topoisomerase IV subunit A [Shumkonia mesophila]